MKLAFIDNNKDIRFWLGKGVDVMPMPNARNCEKQVKTKYLCIFGVDRRSKFIRARNVG